MNMADHARLKVIIVGAGMSWCLSNEDQMLIQRDRDCWTHSRSNAEGVFGHHCEQWNIFGSATFTHTFALS